MSIVTHYVPSPISQAPDGSLQWSTRKGDKYLVTGLTPKGKRVRKQCPDWYAAQGVNLYQGTKWLLRNGRRYMIQRVVN